MDKRYDYFGQELNQFDAVVTGTSIDRGRGFICGTITAFTLKKIKVKDLLNKTWNGEDRVYLCDETQLIKIDPELVTLKILKGL